jgi:hypothetical protein
MPFFANISGKDLPSMFDHHARSICHCRKMLSSWPDAMLCNLL